MIRTLMFAAAVAGSWHFGTERDPMGQPVYVAEVAPDGARTLKYLCGGVTGVVLQINLGDAEYGEGQFSTDEPPEETLHFEFPEGTYDTLAKRAPSGPTL